MTNRYTQPPKLDEDFYKKWQKDFLKGKKHVKNSETGFTLY